MTLPETVCCANCRCREDGLTVQSVRRPKRQSGRITTSKASEQNRVE
jgi:hypothetical protein